MVKSGPERGRLTIGDVQARMGIPEDLNSVWPGAVPSILTRRGIFRRPGYAQSQRPAAHARPPCRRSGDNRIFKVTNRLGQQAPAGPRCTRFFSGFSSLAEFPCGVFLGLGGNFLPDRESKG